MAARFVRRIRVLAERRRIRNERVFRDRTNPWELYDDDAMLARYRFRRSDICVIVDALTAELDYARLGGTVSVAITSNSRCNELRDTFQ